jgi:sarcosine oxidase
MDLDAEVGVVGTGTMGSMTLWQLARQGVSAIGFEQYAPGHDRGAGAGETRQYRAEYLEPQVLPLMARATELYRILEEDSGMHLLHLTGGLTIGPPGSVLVSDLVSQIRAAGHDPVIIDRTQMQARYPQHKLADDDIVIWDAGTGYLRPELAITGALTAAKQHGGCIIRDAEITGIEQREGHVRLHASGRQWRVRRAVMTTGAWTWRLLPDLVPGGDLGRLVLTWFPVGDDYAFSQERFPTFTRTVEDITIYGMPAIAPGTVRIGLVGPRARFADPSELVRAATRAELSSISGLVARWMPDVIPAVIRTGVHLDAYTPDGQPLLGPLPGQEDVFIAAAFSGRGFKMAPVIGSLLARLASGQPAGIDLSPWEPGRFRL